MEQRVKGTKERPECNYICVEVIPQPNGGDFSMYLAAPAHTLSGVLAHRLAHALCNRCTTNASSIKTTKGDGSNARAPTAMDDGACIPFAGQKNVQISPFDRNY